MFWRWNERCICEKTSSIVRILCLEEQGSCFYVICRKQLNEFTTWQFQPQPRNFAVLSVIINEHNERWYQHLMQQRRKGMQPLSEMEEQLQGGGDDAYSENWFRSAACVTRCVFFNAGSEGAQQYAPGIADRWPRVCSALSCSVLWCSRGRSAKKELNARRNLVGGWLRMFEVLRGDVGHTGNGFKRWTVRCVWPQLRSRVVVACTSQQQHENSSGKAAFPTTHKHPRIGCRRFVCLIPRVAGWDSCRVARYGDRFVGARVGGACLFGIVGVAMRVGVAVETCADFQW